MCCECLYLHKADSCHRSLRNLKEHNKRVAPFLNELRDLVKYIVRRDNPNVTIRTPQKEEFDDVEIVVDAAGSQGVTNSMTNQVD